MSHLHERKEKVCLNCGAQLYDRYCHKCGQENVEPKENFLHLTRHFLEDVTHFDGKFFSTVKALILKPGFLTAEYIRGRRASYINPIRLYLFISAIFFLAFISVFTNNDAHEKLPPSKIAKLDSAMTHLKEAQVGLTEGLSAEDSATVSTALQKSDTTVFTYDYNDSYAPEQTVAEYDSVQKILAKNKRDGWLQHYFKRRMIAARQYSHENPGEYMHKVKESFFHSLPYMLFLSLPLIALLMKLLYIRRREFFYVSHIIFLLHYYCLVFVAIFIVNVLHKWCGQAGSILSPFVTLGYFIYLYAAMLRFYKQGWFKTLVKYFILIFFAAIILIVLLVIFGVNSVLNTGV
ncbi:MAG: DUF3667 domain-containing protein [Bacteroidetes bacterium]|nr:DUF3667 domain-containing protein [Bacteroidota bacterium]